VAAVPYAAAYDDLVTTFRNLLKPDGAVILTYQVSISFVDMPSRLLEVLLPISVHNRNSESCVTIPPLR
jgi:hypothetical protein